MSHPKDKQSGVNEMSQYSKRQHHASPRLTVRRSNRNDTTFLSHTASGTMLKELVRVLGPKARARSSVRGSSNQKIIACGR